MRIKTGFLRRLVILGIGLIVAATTTPARGWSETITFIGFECVQRPSCIGAPTPGNPVAETMLIFTGRDVDPFNTGGLTYACPAFPMASYLAQEVVVITRGQPAVITWVLVASQTPPVHPGTRLTNLRITEVVQSADGLPGGCTPGGDLWSLLPQCCTSSSTGYAGDVQ